MLACANMLTCWLASRRQYHELSSVHALPRRTDEAERLLVEALQTQCLSVQVDAAEYRVPVRSVLGHLPADHCRVVFRHVPPEAALAGFTEAVLAAAGYGELSGVSVVQERCAVAPAVGVEDFSLPVLDTVVATVRVPAEHAGLPGLPRAIPACGYLMTVEVEVSVVPAGQLVLRQLVPAQAGLPEVQHPGVRPSMARVYAAAGIQRQPPVGGAAVAALGGALPPGARTGLGFVPAAAGAAGPAAVAAAMPDAVAVGADALPDADGVAAAPAAVGPVPPAPLAAHAGPQEPMPPAAPEAPEPLDEPGFDAACQLVLDAVDGCTAGAAKAVVQLGRLAVPAAYADAAQASTPGGLPRAFRVAVHAQAQLRFGAARAEALRVLPREGVGDLPANADELLGLQDMVAEPPAPSLVAARPPRPSQARGRRSAAAGSPSASSAPVSRRSSRDRSSGDWRALQQAALGGGPARGDASTSRGGGIARPRAA